MTVRLFQTCHCNSPCFPKAAAAADEHKQQRACAPCPARPHRRAPESRTAAPLLAPEPPEGQPEPPVPPLPAGLRPALSPCPGRAFRAQQQAGPQGCTAASLERAHPRATADHARHTRAAGRQSFSSTHQHSREKKV